MLWVVIYYGGGCCRCVQLQLNNDPLLLPDQSARAFAADEVVLVEPVADVEAAGAAGGQPAGDHPEPQDVQFPGLQIVQDRLQALRQSLLHHHRRQGRERTHRPRTHADLRRNTRQVLRQRLRTRPHLQLPQGTSLPIQTYFILDELLVSGFISESNKNLIHKELQVQKDIFDEKEEKNTKK